MIVVQIKSFRLGVRFSFLAVLFFMLEISRSDWGLWCVLCCILHELGHFTAFALVGSRPKELWLEAGGMRIVPAAGLLAPGKEAFVLCGGCLINFLSAGLLFWLSCPQAAGFHLFLGIFNLFAVKSLDGGRLLALFLEQKAPSAAAFLSNAAHGVCAALLGALGFWAFKETGNFTLLLTLFCLLFQGK